MASARGREDGVGIEIGRKITDKTGEASRSWRRGVNFFLSAVRVFGDGGATYGQTVDN
jgi:hypothetical protein